MSANGNSLYDWPLDWFGTHRAYRIDRALRTIRRQLSTLLDTEEPPGLLFEAAVLQDPQTAHNTTIVKPYDEGTSPAGILQSAEFRTLVNQFLSQHENTIGPIFAPDWFSNARLDFQHQGSEEALLRRRFDHVVGLVTRIPVRGYIHKLLSQAYFRDPSNRPFWYNLHVKKAAPKETFGRVTATANTGSSAFEDQLQEPDEGDLLSKADGPLMSRLLPLATLHMEKSDFPEMHLLAIPLHTIHRWQDPSYGTFLGWIYAGRQKTDTNKEDEKTLKMLWPLLDQFSAELIEGEISEYFGHYNGEKKPLDALPIAISRLSGWKCCNKPAKLGNSMFAWSASELHVLISDLGSDSDVVLQPQENTILPTEDPALTFAVSRFAHKVRRIYRGLSVLHARAESTRLRKYEQMLQLLQHPLAELSRSIGAMQRNTQELRAVLYEPEEALFASYSIIEPLFHENHEIKFQKANLPLIKVKHSPDHYSPIEIPLVAAKVACDIFGIGSRLEEAEDRNRVLSGAVRELSGIMAEDAYKPLAEDFKWLTNVSADVEKSSQLIEVLRYCAQNPCAATQKDFLSTTLTRIKACLFTPFKIDSREWPQAALQLLVRHQALRNAALSVLCKTIKREDAPVTNVLSGATGDCFPGSYANLLAFIRDFASGAAAGKDRNLATEVTYSYSAGSSPCVSFALGFMRPLKLDIKHAKEQAIATMGVLKDWRLEGANYGDLTGAIVRFANRLPGIGQDWEDQTENAGESILIRLKNKATNFTFEVKPQNKLLLISATYNPL